MLARDRVHTVGKGSFLQFCAERLSAGTATDFFSDEASPSSDAQVRSVVWVGDIVSILASLARDGVSPQSAGVYNMGGPERVTRVEVAEAVAAQGGYDAPQLIRPVARSSLPPAARAVASPPDISMDSTKLRSLTGHPATRLAEMVAGAAAAAGASPF
ncbi:hypothetical protein EMIHUDRAFT_207895 [Emiliania huxleyi CCMP1516]|uniref:RmlD-like substrate binding domain-containing protein n=2 Tax=Emiliania huxleyi TaxID=2903 RepID=A0A0D3JBL1_EMIH1|nr:hypothetical protein EMIHUDRAFT_207895 [Emiliania huxleyi CCMP1516]EOD20896.1 hypothetical protein EMIHUDRAFT_207895 [Emiliania huxleyi CCMP1516]|eukprot:XP_005773325.1 hypothetical protein EMIHUDRAFT_207895 [Emiliania huxleyi CCMP1516]